MRHKCVPDHSDVSDHDKNPTSDGKQDKLPTTQEQQHSPVVSTEPLSIFSPQQSYKDPLPDRPSNRPTIKRRWRESITLPPWWDH